MVGVNSGDGRGNLTAYATVFDSKQVLQRDRDYSACSLDTEPDRSFGCGGSATTPAACSRTSSTYYLALDTADFVPADGAEQLRAMTCTTSAR